MTTLTFTLEVPDGEAQKIAETVQKMNMTMEDFAFMRLVAPTEIDDEFVQLVNEIIEEDRELLESLA